MRLAAAISFAFLMTGSVMAQPPVPDREAQFNFPTPAEIEAIIDELPDFNAILSDVRHLVEDDKLQRRMERSGEAFADKLEQSGALEPDENGLPDIKLTLQVMMLALGEEEVSGGLIETLTELQAVMDKHLPEDAADTPPE